MQLEVLDDVSIWAEGALHDVGDKDGDIFGVRAAGIVCGCVCLFTNCTVRDVQLTGLHSLECFDGVCVFA